MTTQLRKTVCLVLAVCMAVCFMPGAVAAAAKKPAKVAKPTVKVSGKQASITWKSAKNAEKYQVKIQKRTGMEWVTKKTAKVRSTGYVYTGVYSAKYRVFVRGLAKKTGKWSKPASFTTEKKPGSSRSAENIPTVKCFTKGLSVGKTYYIQSPGGEYKSKVKITSSNSYKNDEDWWGWSVEGETQDGGRLSVSKSNSDECYTFYTKEGEDDEKYCTVRQQTDTGNVVRILDDDVSYVWTLDGTEPELGQKDFFGNVDAYTAYREDNKNMQLRGYFDKTRKTGSYEKEVLPSHPYYSWNKLYKGKKVIFESRVVRYPDPE